MLADRVVAAGAVDLEEPTCPWKRRGSHVAPPCSDRTCHWTVSIIKAHTQVSMAGRAKAVCFHILQMSPAVLSHTGVMKGPRAMYDMFAVFKQSHVPCKKRDVRLCCCGAVRMIICTCKVTYSLQSTILQSFLKFVALRRAH